MTITEKKEPTPEIIQDFLEACEVGDLSYIKDVANKYNLSNRNIISVAFTEACSYGNYDVVKYLLTSPDMSIHPDIHWQEDKGFHEACSNGYLDIAQYLLTSDDLKEHVNINSKNDHAMEWACIQGHSDIVKYLATSPELKQHSTIQARDLINTIKNNHLELANYLIFDINFRNNKEIENYLQENPNEIISNWFKIQQVNEELHKDLPINDKKENNSLRPKL